MDRITIAVDSLSRENWIIIYSFVNCILTNAFFESKKRAYKKLLEIAKTSLKRGLPDSPNSQRFDVYELDNNKDYLEDLDTLGIETVFSLLYIKYDAKEDFTQLIPFLLLQQEFGNCISLGIDIDKLDKTQKYSIKCREFFILYDDIKPKHGNNSIYFIKEKIIDAKTKTYFYSPSFISRLKGSSNYQWEPSRRFLPLIFISQDNYNSIFGIYKKKNNEEESESKQPLNKELNFIKDSIGKMLADFDEKTKRKLKLNTDLEADQSESFFSQWLECGYFYSFGNKEKEDLENIKIEETKKTIQIIKNNICELVQNIIFHAGKKGMIYCVFDKKTNISKKYSPYLSGFINYKDSFRFLRTGIYDFSNKGIIDTYTEKEGDEETDTLNLTNFFDTNSFITTNLNHLDLRYAAHLGIKTFVKTIIKHKGYFSVETNVSNKKGGGQNNKKLIKTILEGDKVRLGNEEVIKFANGTHYEIVFPVNPSEPITKLMIPVQKASLMAETFPHALDLDNPGLPIKSVDFPKEEIEKIWKCQSKDDQIKDIKNIGDLIVLGNENKSEIAINLGNNSLDYNIIFKILAYIQLKPNNSFEKIILVNTEEDFAVKFIELLYSFSQNDEIPIWSKDCAIVLISDKLQAQIVWGNTRSEFNYINSEFLKFYCFNFFAIKESNKKGNNYSEIIKEIDNDTKNKANSFVVPYDILIATEQNQTLFEHFLNKLLKRKIISDELGFLVNHENTYIGNKIIVRNYYEADMMFQNTFFTERFAYLIANNLRHTLKLLRDKDPNNKNKVVLIGYKHYSELLLKAIKRSLIKEEQVYLIIANIEKETTDFSKFFNFDIDGNGEKIKDEILLSPESFYFATIVPVGSTLSTNDKIIAFFNYWFEQQSHKNCNFNYIYNHCVIVVRDTTKADVSKLEIEHNWEKDGLDLSNRIININYHNAREVHFTVQIANIVKRKGEKYDNWVKRLNEDISFPQNWNEEKYVNYTENSSINSQNLMGFPRADIIDDEQHLVELNRLFEFKDDIIKGHLNVHNCHHKFYVDTESFVRKKTKEFKEWLQGLKNDEKGDVFNLEKLNILITPSAERESDLIYAVNNILFDGSALIVYLDIKNWRNNIVYKLSFLNEFPLDSIRFHYVDQALLTGETYKRTKSYLFSILSSKHNVAFSSIIVIVNRLPYSKNNEIKNDVDQRLFKYINLYYSSSKTEEQKCELCVLVDYYKKVLSRTVLDSCKCIIDRNLSKLKIINKNEINKNNVKLTKRVFLRLVMAHELYYTISKIAQSNSVGYIEFDDLSNSIIRKLDMLYSQLCNDNTTLDRSNEQYSINQIINTWYKNDLFARYESLNHYYNCKLKYDKIISFLKVISSPPLSRYIIIRRYAQKKLIDELYYLINDNKEYSYDDLKIIKSILKSLSFLKSNALVRKDVIIGVWKVLGTVVDNLEDEKNKIFDFINSSIPEAINKIKEQIVAPEFNFDYSIDDLQVRKKMAENFLEELKHDFEHMDENIIIQDFSRDVQFFIKNALVDDDAKATFLGELLRRGDEITCLDDIKICETNLSLKHDNGNNDLFNAFNLNPSIKKPYINFLVWLFYDNTTIIRKTLEHFSKEIDKDETIKKFFFEKDGNEWRLNDISLIENQFSRIKYTFLNKIDNEYYYSSFKPYLNNGDRIDFVEKLIYVTYAKFKLKDLTQDKNKKDIEFDTKSLLEVFSKIMGADAAFWIMKKTKDISPEIKIDNYYVISQYGLDNVIELGTLRDDYYTKSIFSLKEPIKYPLIPKYTLFKNDGEQRYLKMASLGIFLVTNHSDYYDSNINLSEITIKDTVAAITFLYNKNHSFAKSEKAFRIFFQESGRLMLLLKNEIENYVIDYLIKDKAFELWERNFWSVKRFEKIYANSAHIFKSVYKEMEEFELIDKSVIKKMPYTWYFLTNETISYLYSDIEKNSIFSKHFLNLDPYFVVDNKNTLGMTFNGSFISILLALLETRWNNHNIDDNYGKVLRNQISINGCDISQFEIHDNLSEEKVFCNKHILRTFVAQFLHNSLSPLGSHGHRGGTEIKKINITISSETIIIEDSCIKEFYTRIEKEERRRQFEKKKKYIKSMRCDEYSSTTLTSLQGLVNYMCELGYNYSCDFGFNEKNNFRLTLKFK